MLQLAFHKQKRIVHHHHAIFSKYVERPRSRLRQDLDPLSAAEVDAVLLTSRFFANSVAHNEGFSQRPVQIVARDLCTAIDPDVDFR